MVGLLTFMWQSISREITKKKLKSYMVCGRGRQIDDRH